MCPLTKHQRANATPEILHILIWAPTVQQMPWKLTLCFSQHVIHINHSWTPWKYHSERTKGSVHRLVPEVVCSITVPVLWSHEWRCLEEWKSSTQAGTVQPTLQTSIIPSAITWFWLQNGWPEFLETTRAVGYAPSDEWDQPQPELQLGSFILCDLLRTLKSY